MFVVIAELIEVIIGRHQSHCTAVGKVISRPLATVELILKIDNLGENGILQLEANVKITKKQIEDHGEKFEKVKDGFIDFLLLISRMFGSYF